MFQCGICKSEYARSDHLLRHVRTHTRQRPFICSVCAKGFARQDLLKRHLGTHVGGGPTGSGKETRLIAHSGLQYQRVQEACVACAAKKLKCTEKKPCERCTLKGLQCKFKSGSDLSSQNSTNRSVAESCQVAEIADSDSQNRRVNGFAAESVAEILPSSQDAILEASSAVNTHGDDMTAYQNSFMQDVLCNTLDIPDIGEFIQQDSESTLGDLDFSFLDHMNTYESHSTFQSSLPLSDPAVLLLSPPLGFGSEAFRQSNIHNGWKPGTEDHHRQEYPNLILSQKLRQGDLNRLSEVLPNQQKSISPLMRDRILAMILRSACASATDRIISSFPSLEVLNDLIQLAFLHMAENQVIQIVHVPTINLAEQRPEFLGSLIAYGSVYSPNHTVRRFGYALQEIVRAAVLRLVRIHPAMVTTIGGLNH